MAKIKIEVDIPDYEVKHCDNVHNGKKCRWLKSYDYGFKYYCILSGKDITKISNDRTKIHRPYGCRCLVKLV